jgi:peptidoglycan/LPS O-acetylase OafA/YrhL
MNGFRAKHVPALDGLRGLAILLVITHHQLIPLSLKGGFLGVDLFFVLSGFLITTLLLAEFDAAKTISLGNFYARRALRLGPALLLYLLVCLIVTYHSQMFEWTHELKLVGIALVYSTNWRIAMGWDAALDPTAIIWSLSIAEQFYLLWPVLFFVCLLVKLKRTHIIAGLVLVVLSIMLHRYSLWRSGAELNRLYYGTDTRADAPLLGCLMAMIPRWKLSVSRKPYFQIGVLLAVLCLIGLVLTTHFTDQFLYQGGYTAIAVLSGVVTWSVANEPPRLLSACLEWYPLRWFGKISYGLYLWHWLLLKTVSLYYLVGYCDPWARFVLAVGVSALSFYVVERPFNKLKTRFVYSPVAKPLPIVAAIKTTPSEALDRSFTTAAVIQTSEQEA